MWVECVRCRHRWDDDNPEHEVCACLDQTGSRQVVELPTITLPLIPNAVGNSLSEVIELQPPRKPRLYIAKWWMKPICWLQGRPTRQWRA